MNTKSLPAIGGALLAAVLAGALLYLFFAEPAPQTHGQTATVPGIRKQPENEPDAPRGGPIADMRPSERVLTDAQYQQEVEDAKRRRLSGNGTPAWEQENAAREGDEAVLVVPPVGFLEPEPSLVLDEDAAQALQAVKQAFADAMRNAGDPSSPEYLDRWLAEQDRADELLRSYLGPVDFSRFHALRR